MNSDNLIAIGRIAGTHGYSGMLKVIPLTDFPERFYKLEKIILNRAGRPEIYTIKGVRAHKNYYLFDFDGIDSMEVAQGFRNALLQIDESELYPLPEGYYYHFQLLHLSVYDENRGLLGEIKEIIETGANDVYVIDSPHYGEILIPAIKDVIMAVKLEEKRMDIRLLPGLLEG